MEHFLFMRRFLAAPARVGSLLPSSHRLAAAVASAIPWDRCHAVAEFGPGTGRVTAELLRRLPPSGRLLLFEADPDFRRHLARRFPGVPVYPDAADLPRALADCGLRHVSAIVSGVPFAVLPDPVRSQLLDQSRACLAPGGTFVAYQYTPNLYFAARQHFPHVRARLVLWNLPPAIVLRCSA